MLTPSYLLHATEPAEEIAERLHQEIINRIIERILRRFKRGDDYILTAQDKWQIEVLQDAGFLLEDIQKEIVAAVPYMQSELVAAMEDAGVRALDYDDAIYCAAGLNPTDLTQSPNLIRIMQRDFEATLGEWTNFTRTTANAAQQTFIRVCDTAYHQAMTGTVSVSQAVKEAIADLITEGISVQYANGYKTTIEAATARAVRTGISQASAHIQLARMDEMKVDLVLVSSHLGARPSHQVWQGKVYSRNGGDDYPDFVESTGYGTVTGLCGANCRHNFGPYFEGMDNPFEQYDAEENKKAYETQQKQRAMERRIRDTKRQTMNWKEAMDKETDPVKKAMFEAEYQRKAALLQKQNAAYSQFCKDNGLKKQADRISIAKWDRQQAAMARGAAKRHDPESIDTIAAKSYNGKNDLEQHTRYKSVLKDKVPESLEDFQQMKHENPELWNTLKQQYRVVNQYKVDTGEFDVDEILSLDDQLITEKRQNFKSRYKRSGNIAGAYVDHDYYLAHSNIATTEDARGYRGSSNLVTLREDRTFLYIDVKKADGSVRTGTFHDTEAKLFEEFAAMYTQKPFKSITMISERGMCDSCKGVMEQFMVRYPDVTVRVISHKKVEGDVWKYRRR